MQRQKARAILAKTAEKQLLRKRRVLRKLAQSRQNKFLISPERDAYGKEILAALRGKKFRESVERSDGYTGTSRGPKNYFASYSEWEPYEKKAITYAKGNCLDIGAGAGRVSLYLQGKGLQVTAIDNSPGAIEVCKARGVKRALLKSIKQIGKFRRNTFDTILLFGNNFGLLENPIKAKLILQEMHKITSPNATILAESTNPYTTKEQVHLAYHNSNKSAGRFPGQLKIRVKFGNVVGDWFDYLLVSQKEMREILKGTGWQINKIISSKGPHYLAIIKKN